MTKQITLEEALKLVDFYKKSGIWLIENVKGYVHGNVWGDVKGDVTGDVHGDVDGTVHGNVWGDVKGDVTGDVHGYVDGTVHGNVIGDVEGTVHGTIGGRKWQFIETPKEKFSRLLAETNNQELIDAFNQLEDN